MNLYPAIDLKNGQCVRLERGDPERATVFAGDPADQARRFEDAGCAWLHVVDLDGAFNGGSPNAEAIAAVLDATSMQVQLGGGIRSPEAATAWLEAGVERIVLGTVAITQPKIAAAICRAHPDRVAVAADARGGRIAIEGWTRATEIDAETFAGSVRDLGASVLIHTDIARDGVLQGLNVIGLGRVAAASLVPVIASGGVTSVHDLEQVKALGDDNIEGVIVGRAIYEGRLDVKQAARLMAT